ncbi:uncharacterized protein VTP21DRAFT_5075 [Calcarisporiella thermophila]|uniref:uncharacterized protein n=1 Tax=Calcarisporiella thermophila TaxID=911321 RepID=UPI00374226D3
MTRRVNSRHLTKREMVVSERHEDKFSEQYSKVAVSSIHDTVSKRGRHVSFDLSRNTVAQLLSKKQIKTMQHALERRVKCN